jgi:four helix bundle suffix protein
MKRRGNNATDGTDGTDIRNQSRPSHEGFIPPHGGYENLFSYPKTQIIYDATVRFCDRFISPRSRTHDRVLQANYLLDQQLRRLEQDFLEEGGLRERMTRARLASRARQRR